MLMVSDASARHVMLAIALGSKPNKVIYFNQNRILHICLMKEYNSSVDPGQGSHRCCKAVEPLVLWRCKLPLSAAVVPALGQTTGAK